MLETDNYEKFKKDILQLAGIDLNSYKEKQMRRRINTLITKNNVKTYNDYVALIKKDKEKFDQFINFLTINVSEFYRNPDQWKILEGQVFPELIKKFGKNLKIWSAACSTGDEPYSSVPDDLKKKYFTKVGSSYQISDEIKKRVEFKKHDLLKDPYPSGCNLIVCRNVVIYFTEEAKDVIYQKFHKALQPGGVLFIGSTEQIMNYRELGFDRHTSFFFEKK